MNKNKLVIQGLSYLVLLSIIFLLVWLVIPFGSIKRYDPVVMTTFIINGSIWTALLLYEVKRHSYSFAIIHWCFFLLFFFFAAMVQYMNNRFPWIQYRSDDILIETNLVLLLWTLGIVIGMFTRLSKKNRGTRIERYLSTTIVYKRCSVFLLVLVIIMLWRIQTVGFINLLAGGTSSYSISDESSISLLISHSVQAIAYFSAIITIQEYKTKKIRFSFLLIGLGCLIVSYPPTGISRYAAAAIYMGVILTSFDSLKKNKLFIFILLGGFSFVFPLLNAFRHAAFGDVDISSAAYEIIDDFSTMWLAGDYDAYTMLTLVIDNVSKHGCTWMRQLLGAIFFWVPRNFWKNKPVGSGYHVAEQLGWSFKNLSCPLPGEAYINLGFIGIIIFSIFVGKMMKYFDGIYWKDCENGNRRIDLLYPVIVIFFFFVCRGDLLSSTAYMATYIVMGIVLIAVEKILVTNEKKSNSPNGNGY